MVIKITNDELEHLEHLKQEAPDIFCTVRREALKNGEITWNIFFHLGPDEPSFEGDEARCFVIGFNDHDGPKASALAYFLATLCNAAPKLLEEIEKLRGREEYLLSEICTVCPSQPRSDSCHVDCEYFYEDKSNAHD